MFSQTDKILVFDHGHVFVVDKMGSDAGIEQAARLSYSGSGTRRVRDTEKLLRYLMRHRHTSPFEQAVITLNMKMPIFVARQFVRHRTQAINEISGRYSVLPEEFYSPERLHYQSTTNKQGSSVPLSRQDSDVLLMQMRAEAKEMFLTYEQLLEAGVSREEARINLPLCTYTEWQTTLSLHNLLHMLELRLHPHAQYEARVYAEAIAKIVADWVPLTWKAFCDYRLNAVTFSATEMSVLAQLIRHADKSKLEEMCSDLTAREVKEFAEKLKELEKRHG